MVLEPKDALIQYHFAERLKLDIMMIVYQYLTVSSLKKEEKAGAKRILINITETLVVDCRVAASVTNCDYFNKACDILEDVVNLVKFDQFGGASERAGEAMIPITTAAAAAWEVLHNYELL
jgi:hypothetical protein